MTDLNELDLDVLRARFKGELLGPRDGERYDRARVVFNAMFDRRPALIACPKDTSDVIAAISFARSRALPLAVRGGGHSIAGYSCCEGGLVIDMRAMKRIEVRPDRLTVRAQAGLDWGELDAATQVHGLATTGGRVTSTGIAGLTLGSGSGWMERFCGLTCDNLLAAELVTADGKVVTASETQNEELLWGLRGGGGNFGVVTEFKYRLHRIGPLIVGGMVLHPRECAPELLRFYRDFMQDAPNELGGALAFLTAPPAPFVPPEMQGKPAVALIGAWFGAIQRGEEVLSELRRFGSPPVDLIQTLPYQALQSMLDAANPSGRRNYWRSENLTSLPDPAIDALIARAALAQSPFTQIIVVRLGGAISNVPDEATAIDGRAASWAYHCYASWPGPDDQPHIDWVHETERSLSPYALGRMSINFVSEASAERVRASFGPQKYRRLVALKDKYDPNNVFRMNQNITPSRAEVASPRAT